MPAGSLGGGAGGSSSDLVKMFNEKLKLAGMSLTDIKCWSKTDLQEFNQMYLYNESVSSEQEEAIWTWLKKLG